MWQTGTYIITVYTLQAIFSGNVCYAAKVKVCQVSVPRETAINSFNQEVDKTDHVSSDANKVAVICC